MKILCDVCEKATATVICCADEATLCAKCDFEVHAANTLASKHQRLLLLLHQCLPPCDVCQEKTAFIFCVQDRALFCKDCDEPVHPDETAAANHQRLLATGIQVTLSPSINNKTTHLYPLRKARATQTYTKTHAPALPPPILSTTSQWAIDDFFQFGNFRSSTKKEQPDFGEFEWNEELPQEALAAEVPRLLASQSYNMGSYTPLMPNMPPSKRPRVETPYNDDEFFIVPNLG